MGGSTMPAESPHHTEVKGTRRDDGIGPTFPVSKALVVLGDKDYALHQEPVKME